MSFGSNRSNAIIGAAGTAMGAVANRRGDSEDLFAHTLMEGASKLAQPPRLSSLSVTEVFMVYLKVSMYTGFVIASPWIFYQLWMFVAAGLYPHEKRYIHLYLPVSLGLFLAGVCLCQF